MPKPVHKQSANLPGKDSRDSRPSRVSPESDPSRLSRDSRDFLGYTGIVAETAGFLATYIVLNSVSLLVIAAWVVASWLTERWDRFPHLAITSPEKRCGKTRLMQLLEGITRNPYNTANISPAAIYRLIAQIQPTLLLDEAQSISRRASEASEVIRELFNSGIDRNAKVLRVGGEGRDTVQEFSVYSPKVVALIGDLDGVLADRCLPVRLCRKTGDDRVESYRSRKVEPIAQAVRDKIAAWVTENGDAVAAIYDDLEPFPLQNDRMAELLLSLQAVLTVADPTLLEVLQEYAFGLDERDREAESRSPGVRLLAACREIFLKVPATEKDGQFLATAILISKLAARTEEPWSAFVRGREITPEALAGLLKQYAIRSGRNASQTARGYFAHDFDDAWGRYLPPIPLKSPPNPASPTATALPRTALGKRLMEAQA